MNLEQFGREFQRLRQLRGLTQDQVIQNSAAYKDARTLRKIEAGEFRPNRVAAIKLLVDGLLERDNAVIGRFLELAGYEPLRKEEQIRFGVSASASVEERPEEQSPPLSPAPSPVAASPRIQLVWKLVIVACVGTGILTSILLRNGFLIISALLYAALYAVSVFLESAYEFRGVTTVLAASLSFSIMWATSVAALWAETSIPTLTGLWTATALFMFGAAGQWLVVRPALSPLSIVPVGFRSLSGRTAHLKNTGYFLIFVFSFWAIPVRCILAVHPVGAVYVSPLCPPPILLWILLLIYFGASLRMAHPLLSTLRDVGHFDLYLTLFFTRAILGLFLSVICLLWYSSALVE